jgi:hypothetical protein
MVKQFKNRKLYIGIIIAFYILRIISSNDTFLHFTYKTHDATQLGNYFYTTSQSNSSIDLYQITRKIWVYHSVEPPMNVGMGYIVLIILIIPAALSIIIDKSKRIKELGVLRYNGTKYKGECLLPAI